MTVRDAYLRIAADIFLMGFVLYGIYNFNSSPPFNHIAALILSVPVGVYALINLGRDIKDCIRVINQEV